MSDGPLIRDDSPVMPDLDYEMILGDIMAAMIDVERLLFPPSAEVQNALRKIKEVRALCESVLSVLSG